MPRDMFGDVVDPSIKVGSHAWYTVPVSINNASRASVMTLTITYNPNVLRVRNVQDGTFMRQGGVATTFTPQIDAVAGRVDIAITRTGDGRGGFGMGSGCCECG